MEFKIEEIGNLLLEGRVEDARKRFPEYTDEVFDYFVNGDVSGNQKYLMWMLSVVPENVRGLPLDNQKGSRPRDWANYILHDVKFFHEHQSSFEKRDVNQYKSYSEFQEVTSDVKNKIAKKIALKKAKKESVRLLDTSEHLIIIPKSYAASCTYGAGTRWCTTSKDSDNYYKQYTTSGTLIYVIRKNVNENDSLYKIAFHVQNEGGVQIYNAPDIETSKRNVIISLGDDEWDKIRGPIIDYLGETDNQNLEFFLSEEEILSYLDSGDVDLLKLTDKRLISIFGSVEKLVDYVVSKGLDPLEHLRLRTFTDYANAFMVFRILDKHGINKIDFIAKSTSYNGILNLIRELQKIFYEPPYSDGTNGNNDIIDLMLEEIESSKFQGLENFINHLKHLLGVPSAYTIVRLIFLEKNDKLVGYLNNHNLELIDYLNINQIGKLLGDKTGEYFTGGENDDRFLFFIENAGSHMLNSINTLLDLGFNREDIFYMIEEAVIQHYYVTMDNLERLFEGKVKTGIRWFFDNVRMDIYINAVGDYSISLTDLGKLLGSDVMDFLTQELGKLGEGDIGGSDYDFTDKEDLNNFFNENMTTTELYEMFVEVNDDMDGFMEATSMYNMEVNILHKIKIINESSLENDIIKGYENDVLSQISDVEKRGDDLYLISNGWCDFKGWMDGGSYRDGSTESLFEWYFCDEDHNEMFSDTVYDWHDDVWGIVVDTNNVDYVKGYLEEHNIGETVVDEDEEEYILTSEKLQQMGDQELGVLITDNDFNDLQQELSNAYHWSYNHAYESEVSNMLIEEINSIIGGKPSWETVKRRRYVSGVKEEYTSQILVHKLTNFWDNLHLYSEMLLGDGWTDHEELEYSEFSEIITGFMSDGEMEHIDIRRPDYPDFTKIKEQFKDLIHDYI